MKLLGKLATAAVLATSALVMTAGSASAYIVCNRFGECWHVRSHYAYRPTYGLVVHEDNWRGPLPTIIAGTSTPVAATGAMASGSASEVLRLHADRR